MNYRYLHLILLIPFVSCSTQTENESDPGNLGIIQHEFVIDEPARKAFDRGLLLLHSFEYEDAREAFLEARESAPDELMVYWGEAMTHYKALWGLQDVEAGREVLAAVGATEEERLARANDDLERGFWKGVEILYGAGELADRHKAYAEHMARFYSDFRENQEVAAFYALGLMWTNSISRDEELYNLSASVAEGILDENPNHPGALHYVIHAYDDPGYAERAEEAADKYARVAPDATHALHMPSHIYLAMGMWNDVVASNETSYAASVKRMERKGLGDAARGFHSYAWLHYGYLQQKRFADAQRLLDDMYLHSKSAGTSSARSYLIMMLNQQRVETGRLDAPAQVLRTDYTDLSLNSKAGIHFLNAMLAMDAGDASGIKTETDTLEMHISAAELTVTDQGISLCSAGPTRYAPNENDIKRARVIVHQMKAMKASVEDNLENEEEHLRQAVDLQRQLGPPVGPPDIYYPSFDMYGTWLLNQGRAEEALTQFNLGLEKMPKRRMTLEGKERALRELGRENEADEVAAVLAEFVALPDVS